MKPMGSAFVPITKTPVEYARDAQQHAARAQKQAEHAQRTAMLLGACQVIVTLLVIVDLVTR